jgi:hypothetical protein
MSYLSYLCLFAYNGDQHILCCVFILVVFVLCTLCSQFFWIAHFWLPLRYSLRFIYREGIVYFAIFEMWHHKETVIINYDINNDNSNSAIYYKTTYVHERSISRQNCGGVKLSLTYQREVIRIRKSKNRQHNSQKKKYKRTNDDLQNIHTKIKIE